MSCSKVEELEVLIEEKTWSSVGSTSDLHADDRQVSEEAIEEELDRCRLMPGGPQRSVALDPEVEEAVESVEVSG